MDPIIKVELAKLDPAVPFRASTGYLHHTWARTFHSCPELYVCPQSSEEIEKIIRLAQRCRRRLVTVGCGHSPSDLTCTSSWLVNLDGFSKILSVNKEKGVVVMQAGIRLHEFNLELKKEGLMMPNLGSIDNQSIAGAIGTATHGSSTRHGILSQSVLGLRIMLANGRTVSCSAGQNEDLFRAALVSLGALGIITEVTFKAVPFFDIEWEQSLQSLSSVLSRWNEDLWTQAEFVRVWWIPYMRRATVWKADKTTKPRRPPVQNWYGQAVGFHTYHVLLYIAQWIPSLLPSIEWFVFGMQYGFKDGVSSTAVEEGRTGLLMNCLFSQFVNEWALPLEKGPEAITRLSAWLHGDRESSRIPFSPKGLYIHAPIEVRVTDTSNSSPRPYLDNTMPDGPTLYLNATLYRPYNRDPPCRARYYEAFEWLMKELGGRPHWAKNFSNVTRDEFHKMYPEMQDWIRIRNEVDPEGMFVGDWHRRNLLPEDTGLMPLEEREVSLEYARGGGMKWVGEKATKAVSPGTSEESFDMMYGAGAEKSTLLPEHEETEHIKYSGNTSASEGLLPNKDHEAII
ncbi:MAG: D-arabinono-1,4-lactone oxidase [Pycnora praestabilis]|nr:MAG: D-arabinono-1,4-lactone oxidase [Pycnora praestabilis]